jgi:metal-responsive CopG/Arc/MetJ family transcriptional regulator
MADTRFEVRMNERLAQDLDEISRENNLTRADVFRRAIALYKIAKKAEHQNGHVFIRTGEIERELVSI